MLSFYCLCSLFVYIFLFGKPFYSNTSLFVTFKCSTCNQSSEQTYLGSLYKSISRFVQLLHMH